MDLKHELPRLTPAELEVMKVLWSEGSLSAREVHDHLSNRLDWAYSTTRTTLDRLVNKGLLTKNRFHGIHLYGPSISRAAGLARLVQDFAHQVLEASPIPVVSLFAESESLSSEEVDELRRLVEGDNGS